MYVTDVFHMVSALKWQTMHIKFLKNNTPKE